jgi:hypothetical protein
MTQITHVTWTIWRHQRSIASGRSQRPLPAVRSCPRLPAAAWHAPAHGLLVRRQGVGAGVCISCTPRAPSSPMPVSSTPTALGPTCGQSHKPLLSAALLMSACPNLCDIGPSGADCSAFRASGQGEDRYVHLLLPSRMDATSRCYDTDMRHRCVLEAAWARRPDGICLYG